MDGALFPSFCLTWDQTMVAAMKIMWTAFTAARSALSPPTQASTRVLDTHRQVGSVSCGITAPFSWVLVCTGFFFCAFQESVSPVLCKLWRLHSGVNGDRLQGGLCHTRVYCSGLPQGWGSACSRPGCGSSMKCKKTTWNVWELYFSVFLYDNTNLSPFILNHISFIFKNYISSWCLFGL